MQTNRVARLGRSVRACAFLAAAVAGVATASAATITATWLNAASGNWTDGTKWSTAPSYPNNGSPAGIVYDASIDASGNPYTVTLASSVALADLSLNSSSATVDQTAGVLTLSGVLNLQAGTYRLRGGTVAGGTIQSAAAAPLLIPLGASSTLDGVTLAGPASVQGSLAIKNGLSFSGGQMSLVGGTGSIALLFGDAQSVAGSGEIVFDDGRPITLDGTLTIENGVTVRTGAASGSIGVYGNSGHWLVNNGTLSAQGGNTLSVVNPLFNHGTISAQDGATFDATEVHELGRIAISSGGRVHLNCAGVTIDQDVSVPSGSYLELHGSWTNKATITVTNAKLNANPGINQGTINVIQSTLILGANSPYSLTVADFVGINVPGSIVQIWNTFYNSGGAWNLDPAAASWELAGCTFIGGTIAAPAGTLLTIKSATLQGGVTLNADVNVKPVDTVTIKDGLVLQDGHQMHLQDSGGSTTTALNFLNTQSLSGTGAVIIDRAGYKIDQTGTLTIGAGITIATGLAGGRLGGDLGTLVNQGTLSARSPGQTLTVTAKAVTNAGICEAINGGILRITGTNNAMTNAGTYAVSGGGQLVAKGLSGPIGTLSFNGGSIDLNGNYQINQSIEVPAGSSLAINDHWTKTAPISVNGGTLRIGGTFALADLGPIDRSGGIIELIGTLNNTGTTLQLNSATGSWNLGTGARINGGTVAATNAAALVVSAGPYTGNLFPYLANVTLMTPVVIPDFGDLDASGVSLAGTQISLQTGPNHSTIRLSGSLIGTGSIVFDGTTANNTAYGTATLGPGITVRTGIGSGFVGSTANSLINQGTISAQTPGQKITIRGALDNQGTLEAINGGTIQYTQASGAGLTSSSVINIGSGSTFINSAAFSSSGLLGGSGTFQNTTTTATIGGTQNWQIGARLDVISGTVNLNSDAGNLAGANLAVSLTGSGKVNVNSKQHLASLNIGGTATRLSIVLPAGLSLVTESLSITSAGKLDLAKGDMIVGSAGLPDIRSLVVSGYNKGAWTGNGIYSGSIVKGKNAVAYAAGNDPAIAWMNGTFDGESFDADSVLVKFTYAGDDNLDGSVDGSDVAFWAQNFTGALGANPTGARNWTQGDWNYDGSVDGSDAALWAQNFTGVAEGTVVNVAGTSPAGAPMLTPMGTTDVPEPASLMLLALPAATLLTRRRR